jgi:hypothetical protein
MANENEIAPEGLAKAEAEAAPEEAPVSQPEAEPGESAEEAPQPEPDPPAMTEAESEAGCPIWMGRSGGQKCGRKFHAAPEGVDNQPVCLMHSKDPNKQSGPLFDAFWLEFERILQEAGKNVANFSQFFIPFADFRKRRFDAICLFDGATFTQSADFSFAIFTQDADFSGATFAQNAYFGRVTFFQNAYFNELNFVQDATFFNAAFTQNAYFRRATFTQDANFSGTTFTQDAFFYSATFIQGADFSEAAFTQNVGFYRATFTQNAHFDGAIFTQNAYFNGAIYAQNAHFDRATFMQIAEFTLTEFYGTVDLRECRFLDQANFRHTKFLPKESKMPSADFSLAKFAKPGEIVFEDVDLSRALFLNCDVSAVWFTSSVTWARRTGYRGLAVFEEEILLDPKLAKKLEKYGSIDHGAVEQIYYQLQKNYDTRLDYRKANDFHYGEMEMRRLEPTAGGLFSLVPRFLRRWASLLNLYRIASDYGNSYAKPGAWLLATLLAAMFLFPVTGLELKQPKSGNAAGNAIVTYQSVWNRQDSWTNNLWTEGKLVIKSGITAIDTATFQRNPEYTPVYPSGRILGIIETLLTSSLFALFLLAIRRQFRR